MAMNPYLPDQANAITNQVTSNLQNRILPGINMGASANNNFGSNRHAIAQGQAIGDTNQGLSNSLANLYGNAYAQDRQLSVQQSMQQAALENQMAIAKMGDATQRLGLGNQYNLGMSGQQLQRDLAGNQLDFNYWNAGNNFGLQQQGMNQNFYTAQRGQDLQQMGLGSQLVNQGNQGLQQGGQGLYNLGMGQQQNSWFPFQQYGGQLAQFGGFGGSTSQTQPGASSFQTGLGGALTAAQLWNLLSKGFGG